MRLGVVLPLANEESTTAELLRQLGDVLGPDDSVFCVLDGASRDNTKAVVEVAARADERVRLVWSPENRCVVDAYVRGYREALAASCQWILEMDGGFSHQPHEIPRFVQAMEQGYDYAAGCRFIRDGSHHGNGFRYALSRGGSVLSRALLGSKYVDMTSGFQCFQRAALRALLDHGLRSHAHFFQTEIRFLLRNWKTTEVPITYREPSPSVGTAAVVESLRELARLAIRRDEVTPRRPCG